MVNRALNSELKSQTAIIQNMPQYHEMSVTCKAQITDQIPWKRVQNVTVSIGY